MGCASGPRANRDMRRLKLICIEWQTLEPELSRQLMLPCPRYGRRALTRFSGLAPATPASGALMLTGRIRWVACVPR